MGRSGRDEVVEERGAVLAILGVGFLYLGYLSYARVGLLHGTPPLAVAGILAYGTAALAGGVLGLRGRPASTRVAGFTYLVGGWIVAAGALRPALDGLDPVGTAGLAAAVPLILVTEAYGADLLRGRDHPVEDGGASARLAGLLLGLVPDRLRDVRLRRR